MEIREFQGSCWLGVHIWMVEEKMIQEISGQHGGIRYNAEIIPPLKSQRNYGYIDIDIDTSELK